MNECASAGTLRSACRSREPMARQVPWWGTGLAQGLLLHACFSSDMELGPHPAGTRSSQLPVAASFQEKPLASELDTELATWSPAPADARVSGCSAGAPRECAARGSRHSSSPQLRNASRRRPLPRGLPGSGCAWRQMAGPRVVGREATSGEGGCRFSGLGVPGRAVTSLHFGATDGKVGSKEGVWALTLPGLLGRLGIETCPAGVGPTWELRPGFSGSRASAFPWPLR